MPRFLLVKTSSLGDVVHNLPVASDIRRRWPDASIDWVVEESFAAIARTHAGVQRVLPVAMRRWRRALLASTTRGEICSFLRALREHEYDAVIDTQGLLKSALIARAARASRGACCGLDWRSSREPLRFLYDRTFHVPWGQHAVVRNRSLAAQSLRYPVQTPADYGISAQPRAFDWLAGQRYAVLLHATSADHKLWPEDHWRELCRYLFLNNILCVLPWGDETERARSARLAAMTQGAVVPPALTLDALSALFAGAQGVAGVDTGLTHLAAALGVPTLGIYCATDPAATGIHGCARAMNLGGIGAPPAVAAVINAWEQVTT
jgi:heptosyltransferase I